MESQGINTSKSTYALQERKLALSHDILMTVEKPARYIGGEVNAVMKDPSKVKVRFAMCFPPVMHFLLIFIKYCNSFFKPSPSIPKRLNGKYTTKKHFLQQKQNRKISLPETKTPKPQEKKEAQSPLQASFLSGYFIRSGRYQP